MDISRVAREEVREDDTTDLLRWDPASISVTHRWIGLAVLVGLYAGLSALGHGLREDPRQPTIVWPSCGLLFTALWFTPRRVWPWILGAQIVIEFGFSAARNGEFHPLWSLVFAASDSLDAIVGASLMRRWAPEPALPRIRQVLLFFAATALGAAASAFPGAYVSVIAYADPNYWHHWQLWWAGNWLGSLCVAPMALTWWIRIRTPDLSTRHRTAADFLEVVLIGGTLLAATAWVFTTPPVGLTTLLNLPSTILALLVLAAFRLPPRSTTLLAALVVVIAAYCSSRHGGPFTTDPNIFARTVVLQLFLATLLTVTFMLAVVLLEMRRALQTANASDERYHNFIELSSEAVWRVELKSPMPATLPIEAQKTWLREHAYVAECNSAYFRLQRPVGPSNTAAELWRPEVPWSAIYLERLEEAARRGYSMDGLQFTLLAGGRAATYLSAFSGVLEAGKLVRIWGVARDVTDLVDLNEKLKAKQERLHAYAQQLVGAEERARRATAVDLHDGIGQQLTGLGMTLQSASSRASPDVRLLLSEASHLVRAVQTVTQRVIADLSPPGLYDLGLEPALQWLAVHMRGKDHLKVDVQATLDDSAFDLDLRVLVFQLARELLRNVVKHARVDAAVVIVNQTPAELVLEVVDRGVGFEWQMDLFETRARGFGLWSVADRVRAVGGEFTVDTAPGRGCSVSVAFPLRAAAESARNSVAYSAANRTG